MCNSHKNFGAPKSKTIRLEHDQEHQKWSRRSFLQTLGLAGSGSLLFAGSTLSASKLSPLTIALNEAEGERILVLIRLKGGNDGLNTIVPLEQYDTYASARPKIALPQNSLYSLDGANGLPNFMEPLQQLWGEGQMKVALGVGYEEDNLSHFRSSDIWASGVVNEIERTGILGRYYQELYPDYLANPPEKPTAIQIGSIGNLLFDGDDNHYAFTVSNPNQLERIAKTGNAHDVVNLPNCKYGEQLGFMRGLTNTTYKYAGVINEAYENSANTVSYGEGKLAEQLAIIARMIKGGLGTKIYMVTLGGFDTHANQIDKHQELMTDLSDSVRKFYEDLAASDMDTDVLSMTISEFGRRVSENGSEGTDHGTSSTTLLFGGGLGDQGIIGSQPNLGDLDTTGNMKSGIDFRQLYATVLKEWLCIPGETVDALMQEGPQETIGLGFDCSGIIGSSDPLETIKHMPIYQNGRTYIEFRLLQDTLVDIKLFNLIGQHVGTIKNERLCSGIHRLDVKEQIQQQLSTGQYMYRIFTNFKSVSKSIHITN